MYQCRRFGSRTILHVHGAAFDRFFEQLPGIGKSIVQSALADADCVIALSRDWQRKLQAMSPDANVIVVENAVELPPERPPNRHNGPVRILFLSRMDTWKGVHDLLAAAAILTERGTAFELTLAGPAGSAGSEAELRAAAAGIFAPGRVQYIGPVLGDAKTKWLEWADLFVQPSLCEGMPLTVLEAFAHSLPVVATNVGALPEIITPGEHGLLVPPRDTCALASALDELLRNPARRAEMSAAARQAAKTRFSPARFKQELLDLYDLMAAASEKTHRVLSASPASS